MNDRELLELAAKAGGYEVVGWNDGLEPYSSGVGYILKAGRIWNPLVCDGDALRLAVALYMFDSGALMQLRLEETRLDPSRSEAQIMRRAIVRTAAAIQQAREAK